MDEIYDAVVSEADRRLIAAMDEIESAGITSFTELAVRAPEFWNSLRSRPRLRAQVVSALGWCADLHIEALKNVGEPAAVEALLRLGCDRAPSLWRLAPELCATLRKEGVLERVFAQVGVRELRPDALLLGQELQRRGLLGAALPPGDPRVVAAILLKLDAVQGNVTAEQTQGPDGSPQLHFPQSGWTLHLTSAHHVTSEGWSVATAARTVWLDAGLLDCPGGVVPFNRAVMAATACIAEPQPQGERTQQ